MPSVRRFRFTLNNPTQEHIAALSAWPIEDVKFIIFQGESGALGTPHLQGYIETRRAFGLKDLNRAIFFNKANLGTAYGDAAANIAYCSKEDTYDEDVCPRVRNGEAGPKQGKRNDLLNIKNMIDAGASYEDICEEEFSTVAKVDRFVKARIAARDAQKQKDELKAIFSSTLLWTWQHNLGVLLQDIPDPRKVFWFWESDGNKGKSFMARYLSVTADALILEAGRRVDLAHIFVTTIPTPKIVVFDLARTVAPAEEGKHSPIDVVYSLMESLKNGYIVSTKYDSKGLRFTVPHVVVFANFEPDLSKMSADRWQVMHIR